ncbi:MAG: ABC transporter permease [Actinobacteria bacterium HGW-Actinobacteria-4]|nr:MAG: ABC transporter permease [Actinobacteria bacterium HGW-Actinobacteria-4]
MSTLDVKKSASRRGPSVPAARRRRSRESWWLFALAGVLVVVLLYVLPLVLNGILGFTNWSAFRGDISFSGWNNLRTLVQQNSLLNQVRLTLVYALTASIVSNGLALPLALALERRTRANQFFRAVFFIPVLLSPLAAGYVWAGILSPNGVLNQGLAAVGASGDNAWLADPALAIFLVGAVDGWKWCGFFTLIYIAALTTVPVELKEAARTDGASAWHIFRHVKLPFLAPAFTYNITVTLVGAMSAFDIIVAMTGGGPGSATRVLNVLTVNQFGAGYFGLASMTSLVVTVMVIAVAVPLVLWLRRREMQS